VAFTILRASVGTRTPGRALSYANARRMQLAIEKRKMASENSPRNMFVMLVISLCVTTFIFAHSKPVLSTETVLVTHDGVWWESLTYDQKLAAVQGIMVGFEAGYSSARDAASDAISDVDWSCVPSDPHDPGCINRRDKVRRSTIQTIQTPLKNITGAARIGYVNSLVSAVNTMKPSFADRTFGMIVTRLDQVFENHPRLAKTAVSTFFECAAISGMTCNAAITRWER
jgi:hypothetical protein